MLFLGIDGKEMDEATAAFLRATRPGALVLYRRNVDSRPQTIRLIGAIHEKTPGMVPPFVAVDREGGPVVRLKFRANPLPSSMALGATFDPALARRAGVAVARDLRDLGFNMNLAPVLDVLSNPRNSVIGVRSFGDSPGWVAAMGAAFIDGLQSQGVSAVAKHFPGHGDTEGDSHFSLPSVPHEMARLLRFELLPFQLATEAGLDALMTAHIALPNVAEEADMPATLSRRILNGVLRHELGFDGLVVTDGLEMAGVTHRYSPGEAAVLAVQAGADMVMAPWSLSAREELHRSLASAVRSGRVSVSRLDQSVRRILSTKSRRGLFDQRRAVEKPGPKAPTAGDHPVAMEIARRSITLVRNLGILPLVTDGGLVLVCTKDPLARRFREAFPGATTVTLSTRAIRNRPRSQAKRVLELSRQGSILVVAVHRDDLTPLLEHLHRLRRDRLRVVLVSLRSPHLLSAFPDPDAYVCTYSHSEPSQQALTEVLLGELDPSGRLPVTLDARYPSGHGLSFTGHLPRPSLRAIEARSADGRGHAGPSEKPP